MTQRREATRKRGTKNLKAARQLYHDNDSEKPDSETGGIPWHDR